MTFPTTPFYPAKEKNWTWPNRLKHMLGKVTIDRRAYRPKPWKEDR